MTKLSFRARLTIRSTAAFGCVLILTSLAIYLGTRAFLIADLDAQLRTLAGTELASAVDGNGGIHFHEFPADEVAGAFASKFAQLYDGNGALITQSAVLKQAPPLVSRERQMAALAGAAPVFSVDVAGRPARMIALPTRKDGQPFIVAVGLFTETIFTTLARLAWLLALVSGVGLFLTALLGYALATRALAPVAHVTARAAQIARGDFSARLDAPSVDDELGRMTRLLNEMLERLHAALEANRRFAADASHELRSPLTAMLGEIDVTLKRSRSEEDYRESLSIVRSRIKQLTDMTEQLMILVRAQEGLSFTATEVSLDTLLHDVAQALAPLARERNVAVSLEPVDGMVVYADRGLATRIFDNVMRNAIQYNQPGGRVSVSAHIEESSGAEWTSALAIVRISDTGVGVPDDDRERIFHRFYRVERSRNRRTGGAGLGLAIASEAARLFGGQIRVLQSSAEGTTMEIRLPGGYRVSGTPGTHESSGARPTIDGVATTANHAAASGQI